MSVAPHSRRPTVLVYATPRAREEAERLLSTATPVLEQRVQRAIERGHILATRRQGVVFLDGEAAVARILRIPGRIRPRPRAWLIEAVEPNRGGKGGKSAPVLGESAAPVPNS